MRGTIKTDRKMTYREIVICEESYFSPNGGATETNWGVRYVIYEFPHRRRFFANPGSAVEYIDFYLDVVEKMAHPLLTSDTAEKPEGANG